MATAMLSSPIRRGKSPDISVTSAYDESASGGGSSSTEPQSCQSGLMPPKGRSDVSDSERSERYFTASSGEEFYDEDEEDDGMYITLDPDSESEGQSFRISLETAQKVSTLFAGYSRVIQRDIFGNPMFVAPPPPPEEDFYNPVDDSNEAGQSHAAVSKYRKFSETSETSGTLEDDDDDTADFENVLNDLDQTLQDQDQTLFSDAMSELTAVMEKMTNFMGESHNATSTS